MHNQSIIMPLHSHKFLRTKFFLACLLSSVFAQAEDTNITPPSLLSSPKAFLPQSIAHYRIIEPKAEYIVRVGTNGSAIEAVCIEADHPALVERGIRTIENAIFNPAMDGNDPFVADMRLIIHFNNPSLSPEKVIPQNTMDHVEGSVLTPNLEKLKYRLSTVNDLDSPLQLHSQDDAFQPVDNDGNSLEGKAVVEVYIDHEGTPRLPKIIHSDDPAISVASLKSLSSWRFNPPTASSKPTSVRARIPFHYKKDPSHDQIQEQ